MFNQKQDFLNKMKIALKETNETAYWLFLLNDTGYLETDEYESLNIEASEVLRLLINIVKTTKLSLHR